MKLNHSIRNWLAHLVGHHPFHIILWAEHVHYYHYCHHFWEFISSHIYFASCLCIEQMRQQKRELNKTQRQLARDQTALERQEKQLVRLLISWMCITALDHCAKTLDHELVLVLTVKCVLSCHSHWNGSDCSKRVEGLTVISMKEAC